MDKTVLEGVRGIGPVTAKRLIEAGIQSIEQLATESVENMADISGFPISRVTEILQAAGEVIKSLKTEIPAKEENPGPDKPGKKRKKKKKTKRKKKNKSKGKGKGKGKSGKKKKKGKKKK